MNTYERLAIFYSYVVAVSQIEEGKIGSNIQVTHKVLDCVVGMAIDYLRPTDANFRRVHKRIRNDKKAYPHYKDCI
jgi:hypothetical protein